MKTARHVIITGASSGFGWAMTEKFLNQGWIVHATSRKGQLEGAMGLPNALRERLHVYALDLESSETCQHFAAQVLKNAPKIDVLINNAGFGLFGALEDVSEAQIRRQMEVNFTGPVLLTQLLLPALRSSKGHIINFSSVLGFSAMPLTGLYCASKFALEGWSESLQYELAPHQVRVTVVQPGAHRTKFGFNVEWGKDSFNRSSSFFQQSQNYRNLLEKMRTRPNPARPESVAEQVYRIAGTANPPHRLPLGRDAKFTYFVRRLLPPKIFLRISERIYRKIFLAPVKTV